jgi:hypothetical protein
MLYQVHLTMNVVYNVPECRKESLNSEGQQFHKYQQNEQSPLTI